ncbi:ADM [Geospiza fortis]|uniref:Pro-adrenomedullin n=1 Tax=Geospiza fortis TaxID=48883 RepID=A0A8N5ESN0_GEOFO|nr:ADM [Geospiza fortis]
MKLVHVALLYLGSVTFLGVDAARVDVATEFKRKWTKWALSRAKRDVKPAGLLRGLGAAADVLPLIRTQDVKEDSRVSPPSNREDAHIRVKRYRQSINRFPHFQTKACRFGTCTVHWLVDELHRAAVNDRNDAAPPNKIRNRTLISPCGDCDILERHREEKCNCTWFLLIISAVCVDHEICIGI